MSLIVEDLGVRLRDFELKDASFYVERGECLAVLGPTGSGKSVLLEAIAGFYPCSGKITLNGRDIASLPPEKRKIGVVYQDFVLFPRMSVYENIAYGLKKDDPAAIRSIAEELGIDHLLGRKPETLSGGEKQRVAIARALVAEPELLLMDEPFSALDARTKDELRKLVLSIKEKVSVILATHDFDDVFRLADRVAVLKRSNSTAEIVQFGEVEEVFSYPSEFLAKLCGINVFSGTVRDFRGGKVVVDVSGLELVGVTKYDLKVGEEVFVYIRPEFAGYGENKLECEVLEVERDFRLVWLKLKCKDIYFRCCFTPGFAELRNVKNVIEIPVENVRVRPVYPEGHPKLKYWR